MQKFLDRAARMGATLVVAIVLHQVGYLMGLTKDGSSVWAMLDGFLIWLAFLVYVAAWRLLFKDPAVAFLFAGPVYWATVSAFIKTNMVWWEYGLAGVLFCWMAIEATMAIEEKQKKVLVAKNDEPVDYGPTGGNGGGLK